MTLDTLTSAIEHPRLTALPAFTDNYIWGLRSADSRCALVVDPGDAGPVMAWLAQESLTLSAILITHHHMDHIGGLAALKETGAVVYGPRHEIINGLDHRLIGGDRLTISGFPSFQVLDVPGHTIGHIAFLGQLDARPLLFCGDTLFSAGCGRLFEGTADELHTSLQQLAALPDDTVVCCTHEYTLGNLRFAAAVEPDNADITACYHWARARREAKQPTLPGDLSRERRINPFLRVSLPSVRKTVIAHMAGTQEPATDNEVFAHLRRWKDGFR